MISISKNKQTKRWEALLDWLYLFEKGNLKSWVMKVVYCSILSAFCEDMKTEYKGHSEKDLPSIELFI